MTADTIVAETLATVATAPSTTDTILSQSLTLWGMELYVVICLLIIDFITALCTAIASSKFDNNLSKIICAVATPAISLFAVLFGDSDDYRIRIVTIAILLCGYFLFYFIFSIFLTRRTCKSTSNASEVHLSIPLPINNTHDIDQRFLEDLPANVAELIHVSEELRILTNKFIKDFSKLTNDTKRHERLRGYFLAICYHLAALFSSDTRVHVRILKDSKYQKYIATYAYPNTGNKKAPKTPEDCQNMKDMSFNNQMIAQSYAHKCSLIKTLNDSLHENGSRQKWKNYLMFALPQVTHDGKPVFSMGISVTRKINERFYFLNYCAIESIIGRYIDSIIEDDKCDFLAFIERYYFP